MNIFEDVYRFLSFLTLVDIIFFASIIVLLILIVTLIYFIKINKEVRKDNTMISPNDGKVENENKEYKINTFMDNNELTSEPNNVIIEDHDEEEEELWDLESLTKKLEAERHEPINFSAYEQDQEEKAIISYDELLQKHNKYAINYEKEEIMDDLIVKKVNLTNLINTKEVDDNLEVRVISYQKEEAFLSALKELNRLLN